jgi:hypothetical protein
MNYRPSESRKTAAAELADLLDGEMSNQQRIQELIKELVPSDDRIDHFIGVWKRVDDNMGSAYLRDDSKRDYWHHWADRERIPIKKRDKRIVLVGESVARGYFYDPRYSVGMELDGVMNRNSKESHWEVVDLARVGMEMDEMIYVSKACKVFQPDVVVLFGGNNWLPKLFQVLSGNDWAKLYDLFKTAGSYDVFKDHLEKNFEGLVVSFLTQIKEALIDSGIPVIFMIPGFNLKDWKSIPAVDRNLAWLPDGLGGAMVDAMEKAEASLEKGNYYVLTAEAGKMIEIDPFNPRGYELLAEAHLFNGKRREALKCLESARDCIIVNRGGNSIPRCLGIVRDSILSHAYDLGFSIVDLSGFFDDSNPDGIPGKEVYLDYCHLTVDAIKRSTRYLAVTLINLLGGETVSLDGIADSGIDPDMETLAIAHFKAAIHNAHCGQSKEIIKYHCQQSMNINRDMIDTMLLYLDYTSRNVSHMFCKSLWDIIEQGKLYSYVGGKSPKLPNGKEMMDVNINDSIVELAEPFLPHIEKRVDELRRQEHMIENRKCNLIKSRHWRSSYMGFMEMENPDFMLCRAADCDFQFVASNEFDLQFILVYRTPNREHSDRCVEVICNSKMINSERFPMSKTWKKVGFLVNKEYLKDGINKVRIRWPYTFEPLGEIDGGVTPMTLINVLTPILGEIHMFSVVRR